MNNTNIIVSICVLGGLLLLGSGKVASNKFYNNHPSKKPSDWYTKTRINVENSKVILPNLSSPIKFNSEAWTLPSKSIHHKYSSGGKRSTRKSR